MSRGEEEQLLSRPASCSQLCVWRGESLCGVGLAKIPNSAAQLNATRRAQLAPQAACWEKIEDPK